MSRKWGPPTRKNILTCVQASLVREEYPLERGAVHVEGVLLDSSGV